MNQNLRRRADTRCGASSPVLVEWDENSSPNVAASRFVGANGVGEWQVTVSGAGSAEALEENWLTALEAHGIRPDCTVMRRVFCSDVPRQAPQLDSFSRAYPGGFSAIGQPPMNGACYAMWSYHIANDNAPLDGSGDGDCFTLRRGALRHVWMSGLHVAGAGGSASQTRAVFARHNQHLANNGMTIENNVVRIWLYVRDIDNDYQGLVDARREVFANNGLTEDTHYIASTGIAGSHREQEARLSLDSYSIRGLVPGQVRFLCAPAHLGPTHMYGVTFERATSLSYADRTHILLSGTASIDPAGDIVHPGDVLRQLARSIENIEALLASAGAGLRDLSMILVYLRHPADGSAITRALRKRFEGLPMIVLHAPVCRPGWLVEIEGIACISNLASEFPDF